MKFPQKLQNIIEHANATTEQGKEELREFTRKRVAEVNAEEEQKALEGAPSVFQGAFTNVTNLPGLRVFFYESDQMVVANPEKRFGVIVMDIAQFKAVNEFCGRKAGDDLLMYISGMFVEYEKSREFTKVGHPRADNFVLCTAYKHVSELEEIASTLYDSIISFPLSYRVLPSFGICASQEQNPSVSFMKDCATIALNSIKGKFYAKYALFDNEMRSQMLREKQVENDIVHALERCELTLYVQPKVDMRDGKIYGGESLIRWIHPELGLISPGDFIPVLERNGFIIDVDYFIWELVFKYLSALKAAGRPLIPISINISRVHVHDLSLVNRLIELSVNYGVEPKYVPLELTESAFEADEQNIYRRMELLRNYGFKISMDDFGTGYSSMQMLTNQPLDEVKIDGSFLRHLDNPKSRVVLEYTIKMLKELDTKFIVEGVETEDQRELLISMGCYNAQGFHFYRPMPVEDFNKLLISNEKEQQAD